VWLVIPTYQVARILLSSRVPKQDTIIIIIIIMIKNQLEQKTLIKHVYFDRFYNPKKQDKGQAPIKPRERTLNNQL